MYVRAMDRRQFLALAAAAGVSLRVRSVRAETPYDAIVAEAVRRLGHPGVAGGIVVGDKLVSSRGWGYRHKYRGGAVDASTVFRVASITKVLAGVALLQLRDEGKLTLDDPLTKHLPEASGLLYPKDARETPPITLRHIVTHTSGLPRKVPNAVTEASLLAYLKGVRLEALPGAHTAYSNLAVGLVGPIVRRLGGMPARDYLRTRVFAPLGMDSVAWERRSVDAKRVAWGHEKKKEGEKKDEIEPVDTEWCMGAAELFGGLYASVEDMAKLVALEMSAYEAGDESAVLKRASLRESHAQAIQGQPEPQRYGVSWWLADDPLGPMVWHSGATDEYSASVVMLPRRRVGAILMSNYADVATVEAFTKRLLRKAAALG
jgi:CubicO group peptidase (beta-lactamase class C family)